MNNASPVSPYGSARDLPSVHQMERQIAAFKLLGVFLPKDQRAQLKHLEQEHRRITGLVDSFYHLLGQRNWVFTGDLNLSAVEHIVDTNDSDIAEVRVVNYYTEEDRIAFPLRRLHRFDAMRPRISLLNKALADYQAGRYYSTVLVLLSVMDGFVNDLDKGTRKGLHTRPSQDMVAWDSMAGHHLGLSHAQQSFNRGFYKTDTTAITELFRNGIMHGTLVNFDNDIVATKAWNRLFAVTDWADSRERQAEPAKPVPSWRELLIGWNEIQGQKAKMERWRPYEYTPDLSVEEQTDLMHACVNFLSEWQKQRWGPVSVHFMQLGKSRLSAGKLAGLAKDLYKPLKLSSWTISHVCHPTAAVAHTDVDLLVNGGTYRTEFRWVRVDDSGSTATEWEPDAGS